MTYTTRRARIEAEKAEALALRSRRNKKFSMGLAGLATAASATVFGMAPANAALEDTPAQASSTSSTSSSSAGTYTVQAGDTLSSIANSQGVSVDELLSANDLSASSTIYPGDVLQQLLKHLRHCQKFRLILNDLVYTVRLLRLADLF